MKQALVIVESPAKAKTIKKFLGKGFSVKSSVGHVKDLPRKTLGVDVDKNFQPVYEVIDGKKKVITELRKAAKEADEVYLAPDPDREGEAIAWHIAEEIRSKEPKKPIHRVMFHEITKKAVTHAIENPSELNHDLFDSQQARRILDRLVGYQISPLLWDKVRRGLSAGRVQSVAVRIVCEREREIRAFEPEEYWSIAALFEGSKPPVFEAQFAKLDGKKLSVTNEKESSKLVGQLEAATYTVKDIKRKDRSRKAQAPFITSRLQQDAARKLGFTAKRTMRIAQQLYEGIDIGDAGTVGLITYMRTDSTRISPDALTELRNYISSEYGKDYLPEKPNAYKNKKGSQDAHEAIRPTSTEHAPDSIKAALDKDQLALYRLIWARFVASQMKPAIYDQLTIEIESKIDAGLALFRATGSRIKFDGFMRAYVEAQDEDARNKDADAELDEQDKVLPKLEVGETLKLQKLTPAQHFTQPPPRFNEASLVRELEDLGIGRPSTYAAILSTIQDKKYAEKRERVFYPTDLGFVVTDLLVESFPSIMEVAFTAQMENKLDDVEEGKVKWTKLLGDFYGDFQKRLEEAKEHMRNVKTQEIPTEYKCEKCESTMVIKWGRNGEFLACSNYPDCKSTKEFKRDDNGDIAIVEPEETDEKCPKCESAMIMKQGRFGRFLACSKYPECKSTKSVGTGTKCPEKDCKGEVVERRSKRGKMFFGCGQYPDCKFVSWYKPVSKACPQCKAPYLVEKITKKTGTRHVCADKECGYSESVETA